MSFSRSRTRRFVLQSLYARSIAGEVVSPESSFFEDAEKIDTVYATEITEAILLNEGKILSAIYEAAPKFEVKSLPIINAIILYIALTELLILCPEDVPPRVAINEAIELAKRYSDDAGKNLVNGILNTILEKKPSFMEKWDIRVPIQYSFFPV